MFPGYKHVREFGPDDEYEDDEEVCYVTLDLGHDVDKALVPNATEYRLAVWILYLRIFALSSLTHLSHL